MRCTNVWVKTHYFTWKFVDCFKSKYMNAVLNPVLNVKLIYVHYNQYFTTEINISSHHEVIELNI